MLWLWSDNSRGQARGSLGLAQHLSYMSCAATEMGTQVLVRQAVAINLQEGEGNFGSAMSIGQPIPRKRWPAELRKILPRGYRLYFYAALTKPRTTESIAMGLGGFTCATWPEPDIVTGVR